MTRADALVRLRDLTSDELIGPAANTALDCVVAFDADPKMMLAVIEAAATGFDWRTVAERDRQRYAQR
jgi:hypothetical protein